MKIAIDCRFEGKSGIGTFIENVVGGLLKNHSEHEYLLIVESGKELVTFDKNVKLLKTNIKPFSLKELFCFPVSEINRCDAFFLPYINIPGGIKIPTFTTIHDLVFFDIEGLVTPIGKYVRKLYYKRAIQLSKKIFTVSNFSKSRLLYHFPTKKDIIIVSNGVPQELIDYDASNFKEKKDYFIFVGNIKKHKGLKTLVEAFSIAQERGMTSKLIIVGSDEQLRTTDSHLYYKLNKVNQIEITGWLMKEQLIKLISQAKALVQPSLYEGFGIPPLEAICLGTDVIMSDIPVFKELYYDIPDCFFKVGNSEDLAERLLSFKPNSHLKELKTVLLERYNYRYTADMILDTIVKNSPK